jgi:hypothetical protein
VHLFGEPVTNLARLFVPQQPVVHEDAGEPVADGAMDQQRRHRGIHPA